MKQYQDEITNRLTASEKLNADVDINTAWETTTEHKNFNQRESESIRTEKA
jgi:hypothetical protein